MNLLDQAREKNFVRLLFMMAEYVAQGMGLDHSQQVTIPKLWTCDIFGITEADGPVAAARGGCVPSFRTG